MGSIQKDFFSSWWRLNVGVLEMRTSSAVVASQQRKRISSSFILYHLKSRVALKSGWRKRMGISPNFVARSFSGSGAILLQIATLQPRGPRHSNMVNAETGMQDLRGIAGEKITDTGSPTCTPHYTLTERCVSSAWPRCVLQWRREITGFESPLHFPCCGAQMTDWRKNHDRWSYPLALFLSWCRQTGFCWGLLPFVTPT